MTTRTILFSLMTILLAMPVNGAVIFSDNFDDVTGSFVVLQDSGTTAASGGTAFNTYGGFIGSSGTGQIVVEEATGAGVGASGAMKMRIETFNGINGTGDPDDTSGFQFLGFTYQDANVLPTPVNSADIENLTISFDYKTELAGGYSVRVERDNGDFNNRVDLGSLPNTGGVFQSATFDLSLADPSQISNLVNSINSGGSFNPSVLQITFGNGNNADYQHNSTLIVDNISFQVVVPEPTSSLIITILTSVMWLKRGPCFSRIA